MLPIQLAKPLVLLGPKLIGLPLRLLPFELLRPVIAQVLNQVFAEALADGELDFLEQRCCTLTVADIDFGFTFSVNNETLEVMPQQAADVELKAAFNDLLRVAGRRVDPDTLFFQRRMQISGDTELGLAVKNLIDATDWSQLPGILSKLLNHGAALVDQVAQHQGMQPQSKRAEQH